uniref:Uncharacterized protein n=1 Tax=Candidatus Kentrum sp. LPFa TaxID=2126335 RepID=A0A450WM71_9GAMM|nr:MAG: hypothetical protein BECKLPF1236B_GA0070989_11348 [Candidatus Kentron sp. LPFa]
MKIEAHTAREYADAISELLPPGKAWDWPAGGMGDDLLLGTARELARIEGETQKVLDNAIETHRPKESSWHIDAYRKVAADALDGLVEVMPRRAFTAGSKAGERLWSHDAPNRSFPIPLVQVDHLLRPFRAGSHAGDLLWGNRSRYLLRVRYYRSVVKEGVLWEALAAFRQAHVFLWFEDITGVGGFYAQD